MLRLNEPSALSKTFAGIVEQSFRHISKTHLDDATAPIARAAFIRAEELGILTCKDFGKGRHFSRTYTITPKGREYFNLGRTPK